MRLGRPQASPSLVPGRGKMGSIHNCESLLTSRLGPSGADDREKGRVKFSLGQDTERPSERSFTTKQVDSDSNIHEIFRMFGRNQTTSVRLHYFHASIILGSYVIYTTLFRSVIST